MLRKVAQWDRTRKWSLVAIPVVVVAAVAVVGAGPADSEFAQRTTLRSELSATASPSVGVNAEWSTWQDQALRAISTFAGATATPTGPLNIGSGTSFTTASGSTVDVSEASLSVSIGNSASQMIISDLNGVQVLVSDTTFGTSPETTSLVLAPGSSSVVQSYRTTPEVLDPNAQSNSGSTGSGQSAVLQSSVSGAQSTGHRKVHAELDTFYYVDGCEEYSDAPGVESSAFGPLLYGIAGFVNNSCNGSQSLFVALSRNYVQYNDSTGAAGNPTPGPVGAIAYYPCYAGGPNTFGTDTLWNVFGTFVPNWQYDGQNCG
jgi:hypothetical protein